MGMRVVIKGVEVEVEREIAADPKKLEAWLKTKCSCPNFPCPVHGEAPKSPKAETKKKDEAPKTESPPPESKKEE